MSAHTPGVWTAHPLRLVDKQEMKEYVARCIDAGDGNFWGVICQKPDGPADVCHTGNGSDSAANARLIALAPEMAVIAPEMAVMLADYVLLHDEAIGSECECMHCVGARAILEKLEADHE